MKTSLILFFAFNLSIAQSQGLSNERIYYHFKQMVSGLHFTSDPNIVISTAALEDDISWNINEENTKTVIETKSYGETSMSPDGNEMCTVSGQYYDAEAKKGYSSILSFYSVSENKTTLKTFTDLYLQRMCYHPTDKNMIGIIGMDEDYNFRAAIMDRSTFEITQIALQGKGSLIPLWQQFTPDGNYLLIGYGNSSYNGGFSVYDLKLKKEVKRISLKDQPKEFIFLEDGKFIMKGNKSVIIFNEDYSQASKHDIVLAAVHPSGKYGVHFNMKKEAYFYDFDSRTKSKLDLPILQKMDFTNLVEFTGGAHFSPDGKSIGIVFFKWDTNKAATVKTLPSFMLYDIVAD